MRRSRSDQGESGASAVEYALLASMIAAVLFTIITLVGTQVTGLYSVKWW
jgi:Flp pilus assembly pilin Flp